MLPTGVVQLLSLAVQVTVSKVQIHCRWHPSSVPPSLLLCLCSSSLFSSYPYSPYALYLFPSPTLPVLLPSLSSWWLHPSSLMLFHPSLQPLPAPLSMQSLPLPLQPCSSISAPLSQPPIPAPLSLLPNYPCYPFPAPLYNRIVTKISSCLVNTTSWREIKQLGISFGSIFLWFSNESSRRPHS